MNRKFLTRAIPLMALLILVAFALSFLFLKVVAPPVTVPVSPQQLMYANLASGRAMQAWYQAASLAATQGWSAETAHVAGQAWEALGDPLRAVAYWEIAAQASPHDAALARHLSDLYLDLQRWSQARDALQHLLQLDANDNRAHYNLGLIVAAYDPSSAGEHLRLAARDPIYRDTAFELLPLLGEEKATASAAMQIGFMLASRDLWAYAELAFSQAAALADPFPEALAYLGFAQDRQGKDGSTNISRALSLAPGNAQVLFLNGLHLRTNFNYIDSLNAFGQAVAADPSNPAYAAEFSTAYRIIGDLANAEIWLKTAVELSNNDPRFQSLLTDFYAALQSN
jgi:tetratricopeptide (TPR) repeat protein